MIIALFVPHVQAAQIRLGWSLSTTNTDLTGYRIYWGQQSGKYTETKEVGKTATSVTVSGLQNGKTYYLPQNLSAPPGSRVHFRMR